MSERFTCEAVARAALGEPLKRERAELLWRCPHPERHRNGDSHPSLKINAKKDLWACFPCDAKGTAWQLAAFLAGCEADDKESVKTWLRDKGLLNGARSKAKPDGHGPCVARYVYRDGVGRPVARKLRFEPGANGRAKDFLWERRECGQWVPGLAGVKPLLYRLTEVKTSGFVVVTEGEKDADAGAKLGLPTCTSGGVNSWREDHAEALRGKRVVIVADADEPGRVYAQNVAASLHAHDVRASVIEMSGAKDLAEFIEKGGTEKQLQALLDAAPEWRPATGAELLRRFEAQFNRYIIAPKGTALVSGLYAMMSHCFEIFGWIAYLAFSSPLESCGKSISADTVGWASARWEVLVSITQAALFRLITESKPTIVIDEADILCGDDETAIGLRAVLNAGCAPRGGFLGGLLAFHRNHDAPAPKHARDVTDHAKNFGTPRRKSVQFMRIYPSTS